MSQVELNEIKQVYEEADLLFTAEQVDGAISEMADKISASLKDQNPVVFCVMNGGLVITGQLLTRLDFPLEASYLHATRYRNTTSGHALEWKVPPMSAFRGRPVLIVDDILDEGHTLVEIMEHCRREGASEVYAAVLIDKRHDRKAVKGLKAEFTGLEIEDRYIFGYGMDYKGYWRNAPGIYAVKGM
ncbi:hypoxanthine-guanine phosphoribosyltransferase [Nitrincola schmidtii]|uniref:hypoxanthine-guanine phosphoribosyltransferase n=1 Tax=Nitrincola schmidtii TaxID=1730894 RepID=UPI00124D783A|nr:hypoxanthine-guanine phosphoribosyltransferase [Nitrincola schmidtii]